jgi:hypothetical protein
VTETISRDEIRTIHREFVLRNTLLDAVKVAEILSCSVRTVYRLVDSGELERGLVNGSIKGTRITAWSVEQYRIKICA